MPAQGTGGIVNIAATFVALSERTGVPIDTAAVVSRLGPPLETELANWFPIEDVPEMAAIYRGFYGKIAVPATPASIKTHAPSPAFALPKKATFTIARRL